MPANELTPMWTYADLSKYARKSRRWLEELVSRRAIPGCVHVGASVRFDPVEVRQWLRAGGAARPRRRRRERGRNGPADGTIASG
jgi:predicted DNA-binding transcriptional regulator AlpA